MLRGDRGFFLAVVGFLALAAVAWAVMRPAYPVLPTSEYQKAQETEYSPGNPRCYPSRLNALPEREAADERYRCEQGAEEHRLKSDDLVQQTRAADAAVAIVHLTYGQSLMGLAGTIAGLMTLIAAAFAAWYARHAAQVGSEGNRIAADTAHKQLRAYLGRGDAKTIISREGGTMRAHFEFGLRNFGQTPATLKKFRSSMGYFRNEGGSQSDIGIIIPPQGEWRLVGQGVSLNGLEAPGHSMRAAILFTYEDYVGKTITETVSWYSEAVTPNTPDGVYAMTGGRHDPGITDVKWIEDDAAEAARRAEAAPSEVAARQAEAQGDDSQGS